MYICDEKQKENSYLRSLQFVYTPLFQNKQQGFNLLIKIRKLRKQSE